jgi:hypothetical protein
MRPRRLVLRKETLSELGTDELAVIVGGASATCVTYTKIPTGCICTGPYVSLNLDCPRTTDAVHGTIVCTV